MSEQVSGDGRRDVRVEQSWNRDETGSGALNEPCVWISWKSTVDCVFGASTKPNLICIVPVAGVDARADTRFAEDGCNHTPMST